ncbi:MAG: hypothetical protein HY062_09760 [Bacteroidetes bacterium]|nr:hypothetical protein [Bacteroidota bacterium]
MKQLFAILLICGITFSCKKKEEEVTPDTPTPTASNDEGYPDTVWTATGTGPRLIFKFKFDSTQIRLDNFGQPSTIPSGHGAYSPKFNQMAAHYLELAPGDLTALGAGQVLYHAPETAAGGTTAIQFSKSIVVRENVTFYSIPLSQVTPGTYKWLRLSLSYQNYDIPYKANALPGNHIGTGTVASFLGYKTYVTKYKIKDQDYIPSASVGGPTANHPQGYWGFETYINGYGYWKADGQAPAAATTVVNPNFANSPVPAGSCVVTAQFADMSSANQVLTITGSETQDIIVTVSLSTNKSFEWIESTVDGYYQPEIGEVPVDMGIRGMIPKVQY